MVALLFQPGQQTLMAPIDNYDLKKLTCDSGAHQNFSEAKISQATSVSAWGTGSPKREFLHVDDLGEPA